MAWSDIYQFELGPLGHNYLLCKPEYRPEQEMKLQRLDFLLVATVGLYLEPNWYLNVSSTIDVDSELQVASGVRPSPRT